MLVVLWMFEARAGAEEDFARAYGADGDWAQLFRRSPGYVQTELIHDTEIARRFVTIDRWTSREAFEEFKVAWRADYESLDARCKQLTRSERLLGHFEA